MLNFKFHADSHLKVIYDKYKQLPDPENWYYKLLHGYIWVV